MEKVQRLGFLGFIHGNRCPADKIIGQSPGQYPPGTEEGLDQGPWRFDGPESGQYVR